MNCACQTICMYEFIVLVYYGVKTANEMKQQQQRTPEYIKTYFFNILSHDTNNHCIKLHQKAAASGIFTRNLFIKLF